MRFLLINKNPAVSKLVNASLSRIGHEVTEVTDYDSSLSMDSYIAVIVDSDSHKKEIVGELLPISLAPSLIFLKSAGQDAPKEFGYTLDKPFLPTDFIAFIVSIFKKVPELNRFITPEAEKFAAIATPEQAPSQVEQPFANLSDEFSKLYNGGEEKSDANSVSPTANLSLEDIFAAPKVQAPKPEAVPFLNLSDEIGQLYNLSGDTEEADNTPIIVPKKESSSPKEALNNNDFVFDLNDTDTNATKTNAPTIESAPQTTQTTAEKKIDFNFDIEEDTQKNAPANDNEEIDFTLMAKQELAAEQKGNSAEQSLARPSAFDIPVANEDKLDFGFESLAREFNDLIQTNIKPDDKDTNKPDKKSEITIEERETPAKKMQEPEKQKSTQKPAEQKPVEKKPVDEKLTKEPKAADTFADDLNDVFDDIKQAFTPKITAKDELEKPVDITDEKDAFEKSLEEAIIGDENAINIEQAFAEKSLSEKAMEEAFVIGKKPLFPPNEEDIEKAFEALSEKELVSALQDGGLLPQTAAEVVKGEIKGVVEQSVQGLLQSQILRDVLKGLKMNITITFEDKD